MHGVDDLPLQDTGNQQVGAKQHGEQTGFADSIFGDLMGREIELQHVKAKPYQRAQLRRNHLQAAALHLPKQLGKVFVFVVPARD